MMIIGLGLVTVKPISTVTVTEPRYYYVTSHWHCSSAPPGESPSRAAQALTEAELQVHAEYEPESKYNLNFTSQRR